MNLTIPAPAGPDTSCSAIVTALPAELENAESPEASWQDIEISRTAQTVFSGVNFLSKLLFSASANSTEFRILLGECGIDANALSRLARSRIDGAFEKFFSLAADEDRHCIDIENARGMMRQAILEELEGALR